MKKLLAIVVLSLCFITPSQADDIRDFQIEGMSIGDSLLDYFSEKDIKSAKKVTYPSSDKYYVISLPKVVSELKTFPISINPLLIPWSSEGASVVFSSKGTVESVKLGVPTKDISNIS